METHAPMIRNFEDAEPYEQEEPGNARFNWLIKQGEFPGISSGRVRLAGPIHKTPATHTEWDQAYFILAGSATIHLGNRSVKVNDPTVVLIPRGTHHSVELSEGESVEYIFVNQYLPAETA